MKIGQNSPKIGHQGKIIFSGYFFPIFIPGPISGPIWFPISGLRPETYFLAGRLDRKAISKERTLLWGEKKRTPTPRKDLLEKFADLFPKPLQDHGL